MTSARSLSSWLLDGGGNGGDAKSRVPMSKTDCASDRDLEAALTDLRPGERRKFYLSRVRGVRRDQTAGDVLTGSPMTAGTVGPRSIVNKINFSFSFNSEYNEPVI